MAIQVSRDFTDSGQGLILGAWFAMGKGSHGFGSNQQPNDGPRKPGLKLIEKAGVALAKPCHQSRLPAEIDHGSGFQATKSAIDNEVHLVT